MTEITDLSVKDFKYLILMIDRMQTDVNKYLKQELFDNGDKQTPEALELLFERDKLKRIYNNLVECLGALHN